MKKKNGIYHITLALGILVLVFAIRSALIYFGWVADTAETCIVAGVITVFLFLMGR